MDVENQGQRRKRYIYILFDRNIIDLYQFKIGQILASPSFKPSFVRWSIVNVWRDLVYSPAISVLFQL